MSVLVNFCFADYGTVNVAEHFTQPVDYFAFDKHITKVPILAHAIKYISDHVSMVIVGGGGIAVEGTRSTWLKLKEIVAATPSHVPVIIWGMGINNHWRFDHLYDPILSELESKPNVLIGLRDIFYTNYVPCVSCMRPEFDHTSRLAHDIVVYGHHSFPIPLPYPSMSNQVKGDAVSYLRRVVDFLGTAEVVVTNTYHGAYWATLLGKRVVIVNPFSNKFTGFKYEPIIINNLNFLSEAILAARRYPEALVESRQLTTAFYQRVVTFQRDLNTSCAGPISR